MGAQMPSSMRSCLRHSSFYVLLNTFHLPDLSSDFLVKRLLPKLASPSLADLLWDVCCKNICLLLVCLTSLLLSRPLLST